MPISLPPLRVYTFIPVTGQIISRTVVPEEVDAAKPKTPVKRKVMESAESATPTSTAGGSAKKIPTVPTPKGEVQTPTAKNEDDTPEDEQNTDQEADGTGAVDLEAELQALEALSAKKVTKKVIKKTGKLSKKS
jgi:hypothetical protein